jgi:D-alanyl-lipoteichoic acid acyltransferase DltB (MBOAT superfamily)
MNTLLLAWMALTVIAFWALPLTKRPLVLILSSFGAMAYVAPESSLCLLALGAIAELMHRRRESLSWKAMVAPPILVLAVHKLLLFGASEESSLLLVGASYYALRLIHGQLQRAHLKRRLATIDWFAYVFFGPVLLVGPFARLEDFQRDLGRLRWDLMRFSRGLERVIYGHAKWIVGAGFVVGELLTPAQIVVAKASPALGAHLANLLYGLDLYLKFAGFSDIAIGFGAMLGFEIVENFDRPFVARTIVDFWRRWHRSLSDWCRDYVYLPVVTTRLGNTAAIFASMLVLALWHEFSLRYLIWGAYHAAGIAVYRWWEARGKAKGKQDGILPDALAWLLTFTFVVSGFAVTRSSDLSGLVLVLKLMFGGVP